MTSDELNSVMGKKSVIFKEKEQNFKKQEKKKGNLFSMESLLAKANTRTYPMRTCLLFFNKEKKGILAGT